MTILLCTQELPREILAPATELSSRPERSVVEGPTVLGPGASAGDNFDFEDGGPLLSGDEEAVPLGIVSNAVQHGFFVDFLIGRQQAGQVDPGDYVSVARTDASNPV